MIFPSNVDLIYNEKIEQKWRHFFIF